jgi:hypothetical protein
MHYALNNNYPIETAEQVKTASDYFTKYLTRLDPADRVIVSSRLEKRASELSVSLDQDWIINYSRMTKESAQISPTFEWNLGIRKEAALKNNSLIKTAGKKVNAAEMLDKIAQLKNEGANGQLLVQAIDEFDKLAGLQYQYDSKFPDPIMTVYGNYANPKFDAVKIAGDLTDYDITDASRDEKVLTKIASTFGDHVANQFKSTPLTVVLSTTGPESDLLTEIIGG